MLTKIYQNKRDRSYINSQKFNYSRTYTNSLKFIALDAQLNDRYVLGAALRAAPRT
jgi:hypothetical protein